MNRTVTHLGTPTIIHDAHDHMKNTQAHVVAFIQYTAKPTTAHRAIDQLEKCLPGPESTPSAIKQVYQQNKSL